MSSGVSVSAPDTVVKISLRACSFCHMRESHEAYAECVKQLGNGSGFCHDVLVDESGHSFEKDPAVAI